MSVRFVHPIRLDRFCPLLVRALGLLALAGVAASGDQSATAEPASAPSSPKSASPAGAPDPIYDLGKDLFDQYAPAEVKEQYDFPTKKQWDEFAAKLQRALDGGSFEALAAYEPQARAALIALRTLPGDEDYADWLEERLDLIESARLAARLPTPVPHRPLPDVSERAAPAEWTLPYYNLWRKRLRGRMAPANADALMPTLRSGFAAEGVPQEFAWIAEVESSLNPDARSPSGAKGLFQLMPETAKILGLRIWLPDDRTDPARSARAAAHLLRTLHARFGGWPLALAAYNAGEGRVSRILEERKANTFAEISPGLPVETRLYVPKVYATIALRTGLPIEQLARERSVTAGTE
jgi:membrane-bound lytic murein transglycosylase D